MALAALTDDAHGALFAQARADYLQRRRLLEAALQAHGIGHLAGGDGLNLWIPLEGEKGAVAQALARLGWLVRQGEGLAVQDGAPGLRVTISGIDATQCARFARDLKHCLG